MFLPATLAAVGRHRRVAPSVVSADADLAARLASPGVFRSFQFNSSGDLGGAWGSNYGNATQGGHPAPVIDSTVYSAGSGSLRFDCNAALSGSMWWTNFSSDLSLQFGAGDTFYFQFLYRADSNIATYFGPKVFLCGTGDTSGNVVSSCTDLEIELNTEGAGGYFMGYNACPGSCSGVHLFDQPYGAFDFKKQNALDLGSHLSDVQRFCLYSNNGPTSGCRRIQPNQWMVIQVGVTLGPLEQHGGYDWFAGSNVKMWIQYGTGPEILFYDWTGGTTPGHTPSDTPPCWGLCAGHNPGEGQKYGKLWLLPYNQFLGGGASGGAIWYDKLILSTQKIPAVQAIL